MSTSQVTNESSNVNIKVSKSFSNTILALGPGVSVNVTLTGNTESYNVFSGNTEKSAAVGIENTGNTGDISILTVNSGNGQPVMLAPGQTANASVGGNPNANVYLVVTNS